MREYVVYSTACVVVACTWSIACAQEAAPAPPCGNEEIARGTVGHLIDGRTFVLEDGREVRLAGIEVPPLQAGGGRAASVAAATTDTLDALVGGDDVVLRRAETPRDRYGRIFGYAYAQRDGEEIFAQGEMLAAGFARVADRVGGRTCAVELLAREQAARAGRLGLWADPYYDIVNAETPMDVLARRGQFALVEGKVVSVRESGSTIYVNFGRRWSEDFTVTIQKRNERSFAAAGLDLKAFAGRRIRVRGWIEERGGASGTGGSPWIEAAHPEQIETIEAR